MGRTLRGDTALGTRLKERIREKTTALYGNILNFEGRSGAYQVSRSDSLKKELDDVRTQFDSFIAKDLPAINKLLKQKKLQAIEPLARKSWDAANSDSEAATGRLLRLPGGNRIKENSFETFPWLAGSIPWRWELWFLAGFWRSVSQANRANYNNF
jgi:hypothetical protein